MITMRKTAKSSLWPTIAHKHDTAADAAYVRSQQIAKPDLQVRIRVVAAAGRCREHDTREHATKGSQKMSNVLDLADQAMFLAERSALANLLQCAWVYNRTIDIDGLRRFPRQLQRGRLSRRVERSPLPFGRHRWVS